MSLLFEIVKNPELAERAAEEQSASEDEVAAPNSTTGSIPLEIQHLRKRALEVDARDLASSTNWSRPPLSDLAQEFLEKCLAAGPVAAEASRPEPPEPSIYDPRFEFLLRVCSVPLLVGNWKMVVCGREDAIAAAAELAARGYASPAHRFDRCDQEWTLSIRFGF